MPVTPTTPAASRGPSPADLPLPSIRRSRRLLPAIALAIVAALTALGACTGGSGSERTTDRGGIGRADPAAPPTTVVGRAGGTAGDTNAPSDAEKSDAGAAGGAQGTPEAVTAAVTADPPADRPRVFNGSIEVTVKDLASARQRAAAAVAGAGGFVADEQLENTTGTPTRATATYRVPPDRFRSTMAALAELGAVHGEQTSVQDVSAAVADVESRVATLRTSIDRLRSFLAEATDPTQITSLEGELTRREAEAASLEAQRRTLADQVAEATIVASWTARGPVAPVRPEPPAGFGRGLEAGVTAVAALWRGTSAVLGFVLPFLPVVLVAAALTWWAWRRRSRIDPTPATVS